MSDYARDRRHWPEIAAAIALTATLAYWATRKAGESSEVSALRAEVADLQGQVDSLRATNGDVTALLAKTAAELDAAKGQGVGR